jgi:hypothetical protein
VRAEPAPPIFSEFSSPNCVNPIGINTDFSEQFDLSNEKTEGAPDMYQHAIMDRIEN